MPEQDYSELERQLRASEEAYSRLHDENEELQRRFDKQEGLLGVVNEDTRALFTKILKIITPVNRKRVGKNEIDFIEWERGITRILNKKIETLRREAGALRGELFSRDMDRIMSSNMGFNDVGFIYYDFANGKSLYTPALLDLFSIGEEEARHRELSLMGFVHYLNRDNRVELVRALKEGESLENYNTRTRDGSRNLVLNAFPLVYDTNPVGVAVFLYDSSIGFNKKLTYGFASKIRRAIRNISKEFDIISKNSKGKSDRSSDSQLYDTVEDSGVAEIRRDESK